MHQNKLTISKKPSEDYEKQLENHKNFLKKFQVFPEKSRKAIYKSILMLPNNYNHLQQLTKPYPILPQHGLNKQVALVTDILGRLYPELQNQWTPSIIHPFVKLFKQDFSFSFECSLAFIANWVKPILLNFPNPNKQIIQIFQDCLPNLKKKVQCLNYPLSSLIYPIFVVSLTDILNKKEWLQMCDFWISNPQEPWLFIATALAIVESVQQNLEKLFSVEQMSVSLRRQKNIQIQKTIKRSRELSWKWKQKFQIIYKDRLFPINQGRYPVINFFQQPIRKSNSKLQQENDLEVEEIKCKYKQLEQMIQRLIIGGQQSNEVAIQEKYEIVEGQIRQYLNLIKKQHANKMQAMRQIESNFNADLQYQGQNREQKMSAIEKRARVERQIELILGQSQSIKRMEDQMMKRMKQCASIRKNELKKTKQTIRNK